MISVATRPQVWQRPALGERLRRTARAAGRLHDRGIDEQDVALARRRAVAVDEADRPAGQHLGQLGRVPDRRRAAHDDRPTAVVGADAQQSTEHIRDVAAEHAAVRVQLVDDDELELLEQLEPLGVVGEDRRVEHVRVGHDDLPGRSDLGADRGRRVAVVGRGDDVQAGGPGQLSELGHLVLAEGLGREQEEGSGGGIIGDRLEGRQRVAQRLARGGRRDDDDVLAGMDRVERLRLVGVQALDPTAGQPGDDARVEPGGHVREGRRPSGDDLVVDDPTGERRLVQLAVEDGGGIGGSVGAHGGGPHGLRTERMFGMAAV
jgi:hypothetical protein